MGKTNTEWAEEVARKVNRTVNAMKPTPRNPLMETMIASMFGTSAHKKPTLK